MRVKKDLDIKNVSSLRYILVAANTTGKQMTNIAFQSFIICHNYRRSTNQQKYWCCCVNQLCQRMKINDSKMFKLRMDY